MFNGIIFNQGKVDKILKRNKGINLFIKSNLLLESKDLGISISCDGVCLTLISKKNKILEFYLSNETLIRSKFKKIIKGDVINLELPLKKADPKKIIIAYEPVWAIGTGKVPSLNDINKIHEKIRHIVSNLVSLRFSKHVSILYGGSVNALNSVDILNLDQVDGALVGDQ